MVILKAMQQKFILTTPEELRNLVSEIIRNESQKQPEPVKPDQLLTRKEAADLLGITLPTLWDWTRKGTIPGYRISKRVYYKRPEIDAALKSMNIMGKKKGGIK
jgi:excisionase family DNA binding protein